MGVEVEVTLPYQDFGPSSSAWFRRLVLYYGLPGTAHTCIAIMYRSVVVRFGFWCWCPCCTSDQQARSEHASEDEIVDIVSRPATEKLGYLCCCIGVPRWRDDPR